MESASSEPNTTTLSAALCDFVVGSMTPPTRRSNSSPGRLFVHKPLVIDSADAPIPDRAELTGKIAGTLCRIHAARSDEILLSQQQLRKINRVTVPLLAPALFVPEFATLREQIQSFFPPTPSSSELNNAAILAKALQHSTLLGAFITATGIFSDFSTWASMGAPEITSASLFDSSSSSSPAVSGGGGSAINNSNNNSYSTAGGDSMVSSPIRAGAAAAIAAASAMASGGSSSGISSSGSSSNSLTSRKAKNMIAVVLLEAAMLLDPYAEFVRTLLARRDEAREDEERKGTAAQHHRTEEDQTRWTALANSDAHRLLEDLRRVTKHIVQVAVRQNVVASGGKLVDASASSSPGQQQHQHPTFSSVVVEQPKSAASKLKSWLGFASSPAPPSTVSPSSSSSASSSSAAPASTAATSSTSSTPFVLLLNSASILFNGARVSERDFDDDAHVMSMIADSFCRIRCALELCAAALEEFKVAADTGGFSQLSDASSELGFVVQLYILSPVVRSLLRTQREIVKQCKMTHFDEAPSKHF